MRASGLKRPTPVGANNAASAEPAKAGNSAAPSSDMSAPDNDPIALSLQQREALGGHGSQISDMEAQKKKLKVFRAPRLNFKGTVFTDLVGGNENEAGGKQAASSAAAKRPVKAVAGSAVSKLGGNVRASQSAAKKATATSEETSVGYSENLEGENDPIA